MPLLFAVTTPAFVPGAQTTNATIFDGGNVLGIEVPATAGQAIVDKCDLGIVDPQHTDGQLYCAAIEVATAISSGKNEKIQRVQEALKAGTTVTLFTTRFDLDAAVAMTLLLLWAEGKLEDMDPLWHCAQALNAVDEADSFTMPGRGMAWPGIQPFPTPENPWMEIGGAGEVEGLAAVNWLTGWVNTGPRLSLETVVRAIAHWLMNGEPAGEWVTGDDLIASAAAMAQQGKHEELLVIARKAANAARVQVAQALQSGQLKPDMVCDGRVVFFNLAGSSLPTTSTAGIGYCLAPVSTIYFDDPRAKFRRYTVAAFKPQYLDWEGLMNALNEAEKGGGKWGGNPSSCILGSPQNFPSSLTPEEFLAVVGQYVR